MPLKTPLVVSPFVYALHAEGSLNLWTVLFLAAVEEGMDAEGVCRLTDNQIKNRLDLGSYYTHTSKKISFLVGRHILTTTKTKGGLREIRFHPVALNYFKDADTLNKARQKKGGAS